MNEWYTTKEVASILGVSNVTVYNYAKQGRIKKIEDPYRAYKENRYHREEVDQLAENRKVGQTEGVSPSELAKKLNVPIQRIYTLIQEHDLEIDVIPLGEERKIYSIPKDIEDWIKEKVNRTAPARGNRYEFYNSEHDIAIFQLFKTNTDQSVRVTRNDKNEWGFYLQSNLWIPYEEGINYYSRAYNPHKSVFPAIKGYTDFRLRKDSPATFDFLDFVYQVWGVENIRLREHNKYIALSIKSGTVTIDIPIPDSLTRTYFDQIIVAGDIHIEHEQNTWSLSSGKRRTTFDLSTDLLKQISIVAAQENMTMSDFVELSVREKLEHQEME